MSTGFRKSMRSPLRSSVKISRREPWSIPSTPSSRRSSSAPSSRRPFGSASVSRSFACIRLSRRRTDRYRRGRRARPPGPSRPPAGAPRRPPSGLRRRSRPRARPTDASTAARWSRSSGSARARRPRRPGRASARGFAPPAEAPARARSANTAGCSRSNRRRDRECRRADRPRRPRLARPGRGPACCRERPPRRRARRRPRSRRDRAVRRPVRTRYIPTRCRGRSPGAAERRAAAEAPAPTRRVSRSPAWARAPHRSDGHARRGTPPSPGCAGAARAVPAGSRRGRNAPRSAREPFRRDPSGRRRGRPRAGRPGATRRRPWRSRAPRPPAPSWRRRARRRTSRRSSALHSLEPLGFFGRDEGVDQLVEVALEHGRQPMEREPDAVIGDARLREVVGADPLAALAGADLALAIRRDRRLPLFLRALEEPGLEDAHRLRPGLDLRALVLARHDETRRQVRDPHRGVGRVDPLPARAGRSVHIDPEILFLDLDVDVLGFRKDRDGDGRGVDPAARLGDGHALHAVHAALELQPAPGTFAVDEQDHVLESTDAGGAGVHRLDPPPLAFRVFRVHPGEIGGEERRLVAAGAGADLDEDVLVVVGIAWQEEPLQLLLERGLLGGEIVDLRLRELGQLAVAALGEDVTRLADAPQDVAVGGEALDDLDGLGVLLPEPGVLGGLAEDGGIGQRPRDLVGSLFDLAELVKQHRGSTRPFADAVRWAKKRPAGTRSHRPRSACYEVASGWRLYFFWNRSTRPAVSMSLCFPV